MKNKTANNLKCCANIQAFRAYRTFRFKIIKMDERISLLLNAFENNGWTSKGTLDISPDWWFDDVLHLTFNRRPVGKVLYITLYTDPQIINRKLIWAIGFSFMLPHYDERNQIAHLTLNDIKKTDLAVFVKNINALIPGNE